MLFTMCDFSSCLGCTDETACTYDPEATINDQSLCEYTENAMVDCNGICYNDADGDSICDENEIPGCTDPEAGNYNPDATDDDDSCVPPLVGGCIIPFACNYDPEADFYIPGSCTWAPCDGAPQSDFCYESEACNYGAFGQCEFESCLALGCTDTVACNYDADALYNDGHCEYGDCLDLIDPSNSSNVNDFMEASTLLLKAYSPPLSQTIVIEGMSNSEVWVYDLNGKLIFGQQIFDGGRVTIDAPTSGIFLIQARCEMWGNKEDEVQTFKVSVR
jgi:hypothetical protein